MEEETEGKRLDTGIGGGGGRRWVVLEGRGLSGEE